MFLFFSIILVSDLNFNKYLLEKNKLIKEKKTLICESGYKHEND